MKREIKDNTNLEIDDSKTLGNENTDAKINKSKHSIFIKVLRVIFLIILFAAIIYLLIWWRNNSRNNTIVNQLKEDYIDEDEENSGIKIDFENLLNINSECIGWLIVPNTKANYPVVKRSNNDYYLSHSFDGSKNQAGWIFADYRNIGDGTDKNLVIYGHNRRDESMFGTINDVLKKEWYENTENRTIMYYTKDGAIEYQIFSIYNIPVEDYFAKTNFSNDSSYKEFLDKVKKRSIYDFKVDLEDCTSIITVSTCGRTSESRTIIHAKKIEK